MPPAQMFQHDGPRNEYEGASMLSPRGAALPMAPPVGGVGRLAIGGQGLSAADLALARQKMKRPQNN